MKKFIMSVDAETDGLYGRPFAIGVILTDGNGYEVSRFEGYTGDKEIKNAWVTENVIPKLKNNMKENFSTYESMLKGFAEFYKKYSHDSDIIAHIAIPVESGLFRDMQNQCLIGEFEGPFPLIDISSILLYMKEDPLSVDSYVDKYKIYCEDIKKSMSTHHPLYDAIIALRVYLHLLKKNKIK